MSSRSKGCKGLREQGVKRHQKVLCDNIEDITKPAGGCLVQTGGDLPGAESFLGNVIHDAVTYTDHAKGKTVTAVDVVYVFKIYILERVASTSPLNEVGVLTNAASFLACGFLSGQASAEKPLPMISHVSSSWLLGSDVVAAL
uniref:Histone H4 n=1 Tax=Terrapene triunguis TaxID=2587831 RepID=A0A674K141_9SAUR